MRELEQRGAFHKLYEVIHTTGGAHAAVENATHIGQGIAERLKAAGVNGVILTST
jgi:ribosomal protein L18